MADRLRDRLAAAAGKGALDALLGTVRFEEKGDGPYRALVAGGQPVIFTLWHGRLLPLTYHHRDQGIATLISRSGDGEIIARIVEGWGYDTAARGSSSRGGSGALRELLRAARAGKSMAFTPDGPRGPREKLKPGVITAAQMTGLPIVPMAGSCDRAWWFEGWDRFLVPKPFARMRVLYAEPIAVPREATPETLEAIGAQVEAELNRLTRLVDDADAFAALP